MGDPDFRRLFRRSSGPLPNILRPLFAGFVVAKYAATKINLDMRGRWFAPKFDVGLLAAMEDPTVLWL